MPGKSLTKLCERNLRPYMKNDQNHPYRHESHGFDLNLLRFQVVVDPARLSFVHSNTSFHVVFGLHKLHLGVFRIVRPDCVKV